MLYCEPELCLAASTFGRGGILSENCKDGKAARQLRLKITLGHSGALIATLVHSEAPETPPPLNGGTT